MKTEDKAAEVYIRNSFGYTGHNRFDDCDLTWDTIISIMDQYASQVSASKDREIEELKQRCTFDKSVAIQAIVSGDQTIESIQKSFQRYKEEQEKTISDQSKTIEELKELLMDCFSQACSIEESGTKYYDHMCLSTYEATQEFLVRHGVIKQEECYRP